MLNIRYLTFYFSIWYLYSFSYLVSYMATSEERKIKNKSYKLIFINLKDKRQMKYSLQQNILKHHELYLNHLSLILHLKFIQNLDQLQDTWEQRVIPAKVITGTKISIKHHLIHKVKLDNRNQIGQNNALYLKITAVKQEKQTVRVNKASLRQSTFMMMILL